jgi:hypothetical protein
MATWARVAVLAAAAATGYALGYAVRTPPGGMGVAGVPVPPPVRGYAEGQVVHFLHTEASDGAVAELLTRMMRSPVLHVPALAQAPQALVASVYVFRNGVTGGGPFGFQPDVFDAPPGSEGYRPLRAVHLVTWRNDKAARELRSVAEIRAAEASGELIVERPGVVVNMPLLTWPGGRR